MYKKCIIILYGFLPFCIFSQYEFLLHKPYADKAERMHEVFDNILSYKTPLIIEQKTDSLRQYAIKNKDKGLEMEVDLFELYTKSFLQNLPQDQSVILLQRLIGKAEKENIWHVKVNTTRALAEYYWKFIKNYELAFEQYLLLEKELKTIKPEDYPQMARDFNQIGESYYFFRDYKQAKKYFRKAISLPETEFNTMVRTSAKNTMGLCYQWEEQYDSSDYYFRQVLQTPFEKSRISWGRIAKGNLGANHYKRKEYDLAIPLLQYNLEGALADNDYWSVSSEATVLADIFLQKNNTQKSWDYILQARENITKSGQKERLRLLFPIISNWYAIKGNGRLSQIYMDSTILAINSYHEDFNAIKVLHAQQKISQQNELLMKTEFALEKQKKMNERNLLIIIAFCLCMIIVLGYFIQKRRRQYIEFEKLKVENELKQAQNEINRFISKVNDQNKILERFYQELEAFKNSESEEKKLLEKTIAELRSATILTDDDWIGFKQHFTTIYPEFISLLKNKYPSVTDSEMRYLMLTKLQMSHKEMAQVLGISADSVRVTWNRVRKKLGGGLGDTPQSLIEKIN